METKSRMKNGKSCNPDIWEGMHIRMLLERMPRECFVDDPSVFRDGELSDKVVVIYHYEEFDVKLAFDEIESETGKLKLKGYFVQEIKEK